MRFFESVLQISFGNCLCLGLVFGLRSSSWNVNKENEHLLPLSNVTCRVVLAAGAHLKAFAAECLEALVAILFFFEIVYEPGGVMLQHGKCLRALKFICDIAFGDEAVQHRAAMEQLISEHHDLFLELYGAYAATPKLHWLYHLPKQMADKGIFNCFKPERDHQRVCAHGNLVKNPKVYESYVLKRLLNELVESAPSIRLRRDVLLDPRPAPELVASCPELGARHETPGRCEAGKKMQTKIGQLSQGDVVAILDQPSGRVVVCKVHLFASWTRMLEPADFFFLHQRLREVSAGKWELMAESAGTLSISPCESILATLPYRLESKGRRLHVALPWGVAVLKHNT